jgi:hypothetical protein
MFTKSDSLAKIGGMSMGLNGFLKNVWKFFDLGKILWVEKTTSENFMHCFV